MGCRIKVGLRIRWLNSLWILYRSQLYSQETIPWMVLRNSSNSAWKKMRKKPEWTKLKLQVDMTLLEQPLLLLLACIHILNTRKIMLSHLGFRKWKDKAVILIWMIASRKILLFPGLGKDQTRKTLTRYLSSRSLILVLIRKDFILTKPNHKLCLSYTIRKLSTQERTLIKFYRPTCSNNSKRTKTILEVVSSLKTKE